MTADHQKLAPVKLIFRVTYKLFSCANRPSGSGTNCQASRLPRCTGGRLLISNITLGNCLAHTYKTLAGPLHKLRGALSYLLPLLSMLPHILFASTAFTLAKESCAAPFADYLPATSSAIATMNSTLDPTCDNIHNCRTMSEIVWSCATTIILCTWVSYHPDIPDRRYTSMRVAASRFLAVVVSFFLPELVLIQAISQWWFVQQYKSPKPGKF